MSTLLDFFKKENVGKKLIDINGNVWIIQPCKDGNFFLKNEAIGLKPQFTYLEITKPDYYKFYEEPRLRYTVKPCWICGREALFYPNFDSIPHLIGLACANSFGFQKCSNSTMIVWNEAPLKLMVKMWNSMADVYEKEVNK